MRNVEFIELRKKRNFSQACLAEKLCVTVSTIRNWEHGLSAPSLDDMQEMAKIFGVGKDVIASTFEPITTNVEEEYKKEGEMYDLVLELFLKCDEIESFIQFGYLFSIAADIWCCLLR